MPLYSVNSRMADASPSVSVEKGAYRLRAPPPRSHSKLRSGHGSRTHHPSVSSRDKQLAILVVFLISATISCFGAAYYLFTTRWETRPVHPKKGDSDDTLRPQVVRFDSDLDLTSSVPLWDPGETFLAYLPHSGFHNQRIAFENALVLSRLLNRTLLVPPVRLGNKPFYYLPFDELRDAINNSSKIGLEHCKTILSRADTAPECDGFYDYTFVPWDWLVNLTDVKTEQKLLPCWNLTDAWLESGLDIHSRDIYTLKDTSRNQYSFLDFVPTVNPLSRKYLEAVQISSLQSRSERLIILGTLFGSSRLHLRDRENYRLRKHIRQSMAFTNPTLVNIADRIQDALGGQYLGAHLRLGDGLFLENARENVRLTWWKLVHSALGFSVADTLTLERNLFYYEFASEDTLLIPPLIPLDIPALRAAHPDLPRLASPSTSTLSCPRQLYDSSHLRILNTPLFISTDVMDPRTDPLLSRFIQTFPCTFFLADFSEDTSSLHGMESGHDGVRLKQFLVPFLDAMIVARAWQVVGTEQSTFSAFVQDVLWRTYHGWEIVQRG